MTPEPRTQYDYGEREVAAAKRVLVDLGQVLGSFLTESVVVVGGWVPDLLLIGAGERHVGSIDLDLAPIESAQPTAFSPIEFEPIVLAVDGDVVNHE